jgi:hypothetical protein
MLRHPTGDQEAIRRCVSSDSSLAAESGGERRVPTPRFEQRATRVDMTVAQSIDDEGSCSDQDTDDDGSNEKNEVPAHVNLL